MQRAGISTCLALVLLVSGCGFVYGHQPGREERVLTEVRDRGFMRVVGQHAIVDDRYAHIQVLFGDEANPCAGRVIVDMNRSRDDEGNSTTVIVPETFLGPDGTPHRAMPKRVEDPIISEMNDDVELESCFGKK